MIVSFERLGGVLPKTRLTRTDYRKVDRYVFLEMEMDILALARAYVTLDRNIFNELAPSPALAEVYSQVKRKLGDALGDLYKLCHAGAEADELCWILAGCEGLPGLSSNQEIFGWDAEEFAKGLKYIELGASTIEKSSHFPFGLLLQTAFIDFQQLPELLQTYIAHAKAAQIDFGHRSHWFLNIAKARLVIHVTHWIKGDPHDKEISGLIAASIGTKYDADDQRSWRHKHKELIEDRWLDPYTTQSPMERERNRREFEQIAAEHPEIRKVISEDIAHLAKLILFRMRPPRNR